ncbi:ABC transporter permease (plasmid) [Rhizobium lusitanum]|jgi:spermidine/putrescine transport system permease protein|uniref:ABC transporter permease n=1 Tax=Rhizobium lusitanum TaxID=293958 RepID=UPI00160AD947|nr:ABC transporter permease [Rhizobium lusitanum]QND46403.1 ABC transporter permease [Rhizobium lusitanum]
MSKSDPTHNRRNALLAGPALAVIGIFLLLPLGLMAVYSLLKPGAYGGVVWQFSPEAYIRFLFDRDIFDDSLVLTTDYLAIFGRSVLQGAIATVLCLLAGFPVAYFVATRPENQKNIWLFLITIPYWVNLLIRTVALLFVLRDDGPVNSLLEWLGIIKDPLPLAYSDFAIGLGLIYSYLPFMILPIYSALERFDFRLIEAAYDLYAGYRKVLFGVLIPIVKPGIVAGCLLVFIPSVGSFLAPDILGGGKKMMIGNLIVMQFQGSRNWPFGAAVSMILLTVTLVLLLTVARRAGDSLKNAH